MKLNLLKSFLLAITVLFAAMPLQAQMVSNNNDDEVNKVDPYAPKYRPGQVIVKFRENSSVNLNCENGKLKSTGVSAIDKVMTTLGITDAEKLMPLTGDIKNRAPRKAKSLSGREIVEPNLSKLYCLKFEENEERNVLQAVEMLKELKDVEFAEPNYLAFIQSTEESTTYQAEPYYSQQWGLNAINMPQLWDMPKTDETRPIIAILDTGVDITHPDLSDNIWTNPNEATGADYEDDDNNGYVDDVHGWDFIAGTAIIGNGMDRNGHGTHCAGIAAAVGDNGIGITGANPDALILPIKVMGDDGTGDVATICRGIDYAAACGANVLSMSFGGGPSAAEYHALCKTLTNYAVLVGAAGNNGKNIYDRLPDYYSGLSFPGAYDIVLGVMASNSNGQLASFSNYDPDGPFFSKDNMDKPFSSDVTWNDEAMWNYDLMAPGVGIMSTYLNGSYKSLNGTSMATPMVAGAISRILQVKGFDYARDYGLMGDMAVAKDGGLTDFAVFNAYQAASFDETNRQVALALTALEIDDSDGDGDGRFDAGETINIWPTIRSLWGHAENIKIAIEPYDENVPTDALDILDNNVDFGWSLNSRGSFKSKNPIRVRVNDNANDGLHLPYKIVITSDNLLAGVEQEHVFEVENGVEINGVIAQNMILTKDKHYLVTDNIAIPKGVTLTIEPGTQIEFAEGKSILSEGQLIAKGTPNDPIVFKGHNGNSWNGIISHNQNNQGLDLYTNADTTLFTLIETEVTPILFRRNGTSHYDQMYVVRYVPYDWEGKTNFAPIDYINHNYLEGNKYVETCCWLNDKIGLLTDPEFLTPAVNMAISDYEQTINSLSTIQDNINTTAKYFNLYQRGFLWANNPVDTLSFCKIINVAGWSVDYKPYLLNCEISSEFSGYLTEYTYGRCNNFIKIKGCPGERTKKFLKYSNFVNNPSTGYNSVYPPRYANLGFCNLINSFNRPGVMVGGLSSSLAIDHADWPSWLGSSREDLIRPYILEIGNGDTFLSVDLSNMPTRPYKEAHGIVWKVVVDGYDAQDEFDQLPPLGVGRHKFEVYYNRDDMDTTFTPSVSMGLRQPYTQTPIGKDGFWCVKDSASVYTVFLDITGKTNCDGLNRIKVTGGKDHDHFDIPDEYTRFNVLVQAAGSMATGFAAEAGMGNVKLTWNNENNDFEDAMGFNVYRYTMLNDSVAGDTIRLNQTILDIEATQYIDYEVTPGETYYYYYKVLSTDLKEYDISNVVAATPLTSTLGDANASGEVDVADVITTVNYAAGMETRPFIFEAADVNVDTEIDILDVIGIIRIITNPNAASTASIESVAEYWVKDGVVWLETPVDLAGVQVSLDAPQGSSITPTEDLNGFEKVSTWLADHNYLFLAYNMAGRTISAGRHPILNIGDNEIADIRLSDTYGHNVMATPSIVTAVETINADGKRAVPQGIYDMMGRKISSKASDLKRLPSGIYIVNGKKVVK